MDISLASIFIYTINNAIIGFIAFHIDSEESPGYAEGFKGYGHVSDAYIVDQFRGKGFATTMLQEAEETFDALGIKNLYLMSMADSGAFWSSKGYIKTDIYIENEDGWIHTKKINDKAMI